MVIDDNNPLLVLVVGTDIYSLTAKVSVSFVPCWFMCWKLAHLCSDRKFSVERGESTEGKHSPHVRLPASGPVSYSIISFPDGGPAKGRRLVRKWELDSPGHEK